LAWQRTGVSSMLVGSGAALAAAHSRSTLALLLAAVACVAIGAAALAGSRLPLDAAYSRLVLGAAGTVAVAVAGAAVAIT
jgi:argininosuccinate lyase